MQAASFIGAGMVIRIAVVTLFAAAPSAFMVKQQYSKSLLHHKATTLMTAVQCFAKQTVQAPRYEVNLGVIGIAFHRLKMQLRS